MATFFIHVLPRLEYRWESVNGRTCLPALCDEGRYFSYRDVSTTYRLCEWILITKYNIGLIQIQARVLGLMPHEVAMYHVLGALHVPETIDEFF